MNRREAIKRISSICLSLGGLGLAVPRASAGIYTNSSASAETQNYYSQYTSGYSSCKLFYYNSTAYYYSQGSYYSQSYYSCWGYGFYYSCAKDYYYSYYHYSSGYPYSSLVYYSCTQLYSSWHYDSSYISNYLSAYASAYTSAYTSQFVPLDGVRKLLLLDD